jgi:hypothetical protein
MKTIKQPQIVQKELNKINKYYDEVEKFGYRPWNTVRQSHTYGQGQEIFSPKTNRTHHLYSRGERLPFFALEHRPAIVDIYEQFPLPITETLKLAEELNIWHPAAYKERHEHGGIIPAKTMTSDFVVKIKLADSTSRIKVFSFKYSSALDPERSMRQARRTQEKLDLEKKYWEDQGVEWILVTEQSFNPSYISNLEYLRDCYNYPENLDVSEAFFNLIVRRLSELFISNPNMTVMQVLKLVSNEQCISLHECQSLFQKAVYENVLKLNINYPIVLFRSLQAEATEALYVS